MTDITAADVRAALLRMADDSDFCDYAIRVMCEEDVGVELFVRAILAHNERTTLAAEARAEGER